jgi:hypothetical protein
MLFYDSSDFLIIKKEKKKEKEKTFTFRRKSNKCVEVNALQPKTIGCHFKLTSVTWARERT